LAAPRRQKADKCRAERSHTIDDMPADHVFICRGNRRPDAVELEIFRVL